MAENKETKLCKHCQSEISKKAKVCPHCRRKQGGKLKWIIIVLLVFIFIGIATSGNDKNNSQGNINQNASATYSSETNDDTTTVENRETEEEYKTTCEEYVYKDVLRNPEEYVGKRIKVTVKIASVHEASWLNNVKYYFAFTNDEYDLWFGDMYGVFDMREEQNPKLLEDDVITVYGEIAEPQETTSEIVKSEEVFCIDMKYIDFISE